LIEEKSFTYLTVILSISPDVFAKIVLKIQNITQAKYPLSLFRFVMSRKAVPDYPEHVSCIMKCITPTIVGKGGL
jgi:hypothetical protein